MNKRKYKFSRLNTFSHNLIDWIGSVPSLLVHTLIFILSFTLILFGLDASKILLTVTTLVSLEAIYLSIFIQMSVNKASQSLEEVEEDIDEIQKDVDEIEKDVDEIQKDVEEIQEDVEEIQEDEKSTEPPTNTQNILKNIEAQLQLLVKEIDRIKNDKK